MIYATRNNQKKKIAEFIGEGMRFEKVDVTLATVNEIEKKGIQLDDFDAIVLGSPTYHGEMLQAMKTFLFLAEKAGLGWIGKHSNLLDRQAGSWFFLGEIYTDLPLPVDPPAQNHCGDCVRCIEACPTGAIVGPYQVDARRCISYLTIELKGPIPVELRPLLGNRIYGCDDCQLVCPWNRFARPSGEEDFSPRHGLDSAELLQLFAWDENEFLRRTEGSAIRRTGYTGWLRNIAVALGNLPPATEVEWKAVIAALDARREHPSPLVREHVVWALQSQLQKGSGFRDQ